jgi:enolase
MFKNITKIRAFEFRVKEIKSREILDSRGMPTIETEVCLNGGAVGVASVPSGASTGQFEAIEKRDSGERYNGKGVLNAIAGIRDVIIPALLDFDARDQKGCDNLLCHLDKTSNNKKSNKERGSASYSNDVIESRDKKGNLGSNAVLSVSLAIAKASAKQFNLPLFKYLRRLFFNSFDGHLKNFKCEIDKDLNKDTYILPRPLFNILNGGAHATNSLSIQEFMIMPLASSFSKNLEMGSKIFTNLKNILKEKGYSADVGDEGGFAPPLTSSNQALDLIMYAIERSSFKAGIDVVIALDVAASEFFNFKTKRYELDGTHYNGEKLGYYYVDLMLKYPIFSIEDPFSDTDYQSWKNFSEHLNKHEHLSHVQIVGDDLLVTSASKIQEALSSNLCNSVLIKPNQVGTLTETFHAISTAQNNIRENGSIIISHRSGETDDTFIADLAVAVSAQQIKTGSLCRMERIAKYNRLLRISEKLETDCYHKY